MLFKRFDGRESLGNLRSGKSFPFIPFLLFGTQALGVLWKWGGSTLLRSGRSKDEGSKSVDVGQIPPLCSVLCCLELRETLTLRRPPLDFAD